jgi:hypothetical protein
VIGPTSDDPETEEKTVRNLVINLQRENTPLEDIYGEIERLKPHFGCPLQFYENTVLLFDDAIDTAKKAERTVQREASEASSRVCSCVHALTGTLELGRPWAQKYMSGFGYFHAAVTDRAVPK